NERLRTVGRKGDYPRSVRSGKPEALNQRVVTCLYDIDHGLGDPWACRTSNVVVSRTAARIGAVFPKLGPVRRYFGRGGCPHIGKPRHARQKRISRHIENADGVMTSGSAGTSTLIADIEPTAVRRHTQRFSTRGSRNNRKR